MLSSYHVFAKRIQLPKTCNHAVTPWSMDSSIAASCAGSMLTVCGDRSSLLSGVDAGEPVPSGTAIVDILVKTKMMLPILRNKDIGNRAEKKQRLIWRGHGAYHQRRMNNVDEAL